MPSSRRLRLTPEARDDLSDILQYSLEMWGRAQRDRYRALIQRTLRNLARFPDIGRQRDELGEGWRSFPVGQHLVFYWTTDRELIVARIMHSGRDAASELSG